MKKLAIVLIAMIGFAFVAKAQDKCYNVKVYYDVVTEKRTGRYGGAVVSSVVTFKDMMVFSQQCASSESRARELAVNECYQSCNNEAGKYLRTEGDYYVFEIRKVKKTEVVGTCGDC